MIPYPVPVAIVCGIVVLAALIQVFWLSFAPIPKKETPPHDNH